MGLARLIVVEGPDMGREFDIPLRGGGIGREQGNVVQLSDLSVSRWHCTLELRNSTLAIVDGGSRNRTLVNGQPITAHVLQEGDEIKVGKTRLAYLPRQGEAAVTRQSMPGRVTIEVGSRELFAAPGPGDLGLGTGDSGRAHRHLAALARLGEGLRGVDERERLGRSTCESAVSGLSAWRAFILLRDAAGRMVPFSAATAKGASSTAGLSLPGPVIDKVVAEGKAIALDTPDGPGAAAPIFGTLTGSSGEAPVGLLYIERRPGATWDHLDLMATACLAHLVSAALTGFDIRQALIRENRALTEKLASDNFIGSSTPARAVLDFVGKVGPSDATVLLTGESGSGKEMVAQAIHRASRRGRGPFIAVNCAALTESLIESELFGHEKGAFTGATERKLGRFELADQGTLFLDEVGELPRNCQSKFLRVLEERVFERVGGGKTIAVDVRVVAATNRNLPDMVRRGQFRDDLYYRLSVIHIVVPPLRERKDDIVELARHFLERLRSQVPRRITGFTPQALRILTNHSWPGNVRELKNAVEHAIVLGEGEKIRERDLPLHVSGGGFQAGTMTPAPLIAAPPLAVNPTANDLLPPTPVAQPPTPPPGLPRSLRQLEKDGIIAALRATGGNKAQAASILEIDRSTLYKKIKDYGIT